MTQIIAVENAPYGRRANAILPYGTSTNEISDLVFIISKYTDWLNMHNLHLSEEVEQWALAWCGGYGGNRAVRFDSDIDRPCMETIRTPLLHRRYE